MGGSYLAVVADEADYGYRKLLIHCPLCKAYQKVHEIDIECTECGANLAPAVRDAWNEYYYFEAPRVGDTVTWETDKRGYKKSHTGRVLEVLSPYHYKNNPVRPCTIAARKYKKTHTFKFGAGTDTPLPRYNREAYFVECWEGGKKPKLWLPDSRTVFVLQRGEELRGFE